MAGHRAYPTASAPPPKQDCLRVKLLPESPDNDANDDAAQCSHADDWRISLGDNRIRDAQQQPKAQAHCPAGPRQASCPYREPNPKAGDESRRDCSLLIGKAHRQHDCDIDGTEHQAADNAQQDSRHFLPRDKAAADCKTSPSKPANRNRVHNPTSDCQVKVRRGDIGSTQDRTSELQEMCARQHTVNINVDSQSGNVIIQMRRACRAQNLITCFGE